MWFFFIPRVRVIYRTYTQRRPQPPFQRGPAMVIGIPTVVLLLTILIAPRWAQGVSLAALPFLLAGIGWAVWVAQTKTRM